MSERFPRLIAAEVEKVLSRHGFELVAHKGSHRKWWHPGTHRTVIVLFHQGKQLPLGTLRQIVAASGIPVAQWRKR